MGKNWFMFVAMSLGTEFAVMSATPCPGWERGRASVCRKRLFGEVRYFETDRGTGLGAQGRGSLEAKCGQVCGAWGRLFEFAALYELENTSQGRVYPW